MSAMPANPTFMRRHRRAINLSTFLGFLLTVFVALFTPPTYQATALISLPAGVSASQIAVHLQTDALEVVPPDSQPLSEFHFLVKPVGNDSPAVAALIVEAENPKSLPAVADNWASIAVEKLGGQAALITHAQAPEFPVRPQKGRDVLIGTFLGFLVGLGIAGLRETSKKRGAITPTPDSVASTDL